MSNAKNKKPTVEEIINKTVLATRLSCARETKAAFKATEKRLYAYPLLLAKIQDDKELIAEIEMYGLRERSHSITRFIRSGTRLDPEEIKAGVLMDLRAQIANDTHETMRIEKALEKIADDEYHDIIKYKYFEQKSDEEIADLIHCAPRTVRTHKSALVGRLSVILYGAGALE